ncbi:methyltransferase domain-containing protein [Gilvimarinus sp. SDUM040013]|uniref:Methyltransferase domain-containing protein n=1 Tax=Gilvimarinus gilvus TaxID=3058038 RepID=A0ABU4RWV5_9GAMM|nr:methyltransferase domain-containing protein [Gilvimarinus sp. SDUM040013]MDO3386563.1 methyltransferase domain-containing protein [Gilvimarinus sp. SDUM040013]MDX6849139.1 methyltransferase domain-containing protein [Gilvimarinus sp. SDUM040013]
MEDFWVQYRCPVCKASLQRHENRYVCESGHNFDMARKGYVHLLLSHQMNSKSPGDNKMMIAARTDYLSAGFYEPIVHELEKTCAQLEVETLLDAGCGEGYYAAMLAGQGIKVAGVDISKEGIMACCRRSKTIPWCIASVADLPYMNASFDAVLSVFCRVEPQEFSRVAKPGGYIIYVGPGETHLAELRDRLYDEVRAYESDKPDLYFAEFESVLQRSLRIPLRLDDKTDIENLLKMTPHYWSTNSMQQQRLLDSGPLVDSADIQILVYQVPAQA